jgi:alkylation response protein AidB-like acyl-CoA dehydrogenase
MKKVVLATLGLAAQKFGLGLKDQQGVLADIADIVIETYACESGLLRAQKKAAGAGQSAAEPMADMVRLYTHDAMEKVATLGRNVLGAACEGDELRVMMAGMRRLAKHEALNRTALHDRIAERVVAAEGYTVG